MQKSNNLIFEILRIVVVSIFVGLCIEAGGLLVNFFFSLYKPEMVSRLYQTLDLSELYAHSKWAFFSMYSFVLLISILKAVLFYLVTILVIKIDLSRPFNDIVARRILRISYYTLVIGLLSYLARQWTKNLAKSDWSVGQLHQFWEDGQAFILMAAVVYIIAIIFKKGVAIQKENDLTV